LIRQRRIVSNWASRQKELRGANPRKVAPPTRLRGPMNFSG
jgi:hypothetical protein